MKLYVLRFQSGFYAIAATRRKAKTDTISDVYRAGHIDELGLRTRRAPKGCPKLKPGECIPVELVPVEKKKARKG